MAVEGAAGARELRTGVTRRSTEPVALERGDDAPLQVTPSRRLMVAGTERFTVEAVAELLASRTEHKVCAGVTSLDDAPATAALVHPDLCVLVISAAADAVTTIESMRAARPTMQTVVMCSGGDAGFVADALAAGARGYLSEGQPARELVRIVDAVARGEVAVDVASMTAAVRHHLPSRSSDQPSPMARLTQREREVLRLLVDGCSTQQIASQLVVSPHTARAHIQRVMAKLGVHSRLEAAALAATRGADFGIG